jgi:hypothetical protein
MEINNNELFVMRSPQNQRLSSSWLSVANNTNMQFATILGTDTVSDISSYGIFYIPASWHVTTGHRFPDVLNNPVFRNHEIISGFITQNLALPPQIRKVLDEVRHDNDEIEITIDLDTDELVFRVIPFDNGDCCCCETAKGKKSILNRIVDAIMFIPNAIVNGFTNMLKALFIPREDFFNTKLTELQNVFNTKLPFIGQIQALFGVFVNTLASSSDELPVLEFEIFDSTVNVLPLEIVAPYQPLLHGVIIITTYYGFIRRLIRRIPKAIGGVET